MNKEEAVEKAKTTAEEMYRTGQFLCSEAVLLVANDGRIGQGCFADTMFGDNPNYSSRQRIHKRCGNFAITF